MKIYILTDGEHVFEECEMNQAEYEQAQYQARCATDGNIHWCEKHVLLPTIHGPFPFYKAANR